MSSSSRGSNGCWIGLAAVVLVLLATGGCAVGKYNGIVSNQERVEAQSLDGAR